MASVLTRTEGAVGYLTLNEPDRLNAVDAAMLATLDSTIADFDADPQIRAIVITGEGRGFCSGAHLAMDLSGGGGVDATLFGASQLVRRMTESATPIIAAVNGVAAGVGLSIALAADYVLAVEEATFVLAFSNIGLMPDGGATALVAASIGRARAVRMALTAERVPAPTAAEWGLIADCVPRAHFAGRLGEVVARMTALAPRSVALTTAAINAATLDLDAALAREEKGQGELLRSSDFIEGVSAFWAKRAPEFTGR